MPSSSRSGIGRGKIIRSDVLAALPKIPDHCAQLIIADPPYFQVLLEEKWDTTWENPDDYMEWTLRWVRECKRILKADGLLYIFGQVGKREHIWLHVSSMLAREMTFHDMIIWDRLIGYNERSDSFTPQYEMILALRQTTDVTPYFNKDAVRLPYDEATIRTYLRDKRYKDKQAREEHLRKGKYATNIMRVPSLKGISGERVGHPSQKPVALINHLVDSGSRAGDLVIDPFLGSGTTAVSCERLGRDWIGIESSPLYAGMARKRVKSILAGKSFR